MTPDELRVLAGEIRARELLESDAYAFGFEDGYAAGWAASEADMAEHWARLARSIRHTANRLRRPVIATEREAA